MEPDDTARDAAVSYHERTKHHPERYARSPGYMDWRNQPDPFRRFRGAPQTPLPLLAADPVLPFPSLFRPAEGPGDPADLGAVAGFCELSMGLSAWKAAGGARWALRMNPSSGNLHPTELYLILPAVGEQAAGIHHYAPLSHALETRARLPEGMWRDVEAHFGGPGFLAALTTIYWREAWKYGERAFRYCHHDVGHALAALRFSARLRGWGMVVLNAPGTKTLETLLGVDRTPWHPLEAEDPDVLCWVHTGPDRPRRRDLPPGFAGRTAALDLFGEPEPLSRRPVAWDVIYRTAGALEKPDTDGDPHELPPVPPLPTAAAETAAAVIRGRRSALAFDPDRTVPFERMVDVLAPTLPGAGCPPFDLEAGEPEISLALFVHRVDGLDPGLYAWVRRDGHRAGLAAAMDDRFLWEPAARDLPLYRLEGGDFRRAAAQLSCHQAIAGDSAFSLGMLARFEEPLARNPWRYPRLFWEAGMVGQVLYLAAEAQGLRGTGIGCYFDDAVHRLLGLSDRRWQSLYHFTVGHPLEDPRLKTLPAYGHLEAAAAP